MNEIKMIATDIDGTLLPMGTLQIPERVLRDLQQVLDRGIEVVPISGRILSSIPAELLALRGIRYAILCNGASIVDRNAPGTLCGLPGACIYRKGIPEREAAELLRRIRNFDAYSCVYLPDGAYNWSELHPGLAIHYSNRLDFFRQNPQEDLAAYVEERGLPVEKIFIALFDREERDRLRRELSDIPGIHVTSSSDMNLEINHIEADKGRALAWLSRHLGIPAENIAAMGDHENDYTMLTFAGRAIVPANGTEVIRKMATQIVPDCALCGAAVYLEREVLR